MEFAKTLPFPFLLVQKSFEYAVGTNPTLGFYNTAGIFCKKKTTTHDLENLFLLVGAKVTCIKYKRKAAVQRRSDSDYAIE